MTDIDGVLNRTPRELAAAVKGAVRARDGQTRIAVMSAFYGVYFDRAKRPDLRKTLRTMGLLDNEPKPSMTTILDRIASVKVFDAD